MLLAFANIMAERKDAMKLEELKERALVVSQNKKYSVKEADGSVRKNWQIATRFINNHTFSIMNGICGLWDDGTLYIWPTSPEVENTLLENGFVRRNFFVPFSHGEIPLWAENKWKNMLKA